MVQFRLPRRIVQLQERMRVFRRKRAALRDRRRWQALRSGGEEPVRDNEAFGRKHPVASAGLKMGVSAVSGFVVAYVVLKLILG